MNNLVENRDFLDWRWQLKNGVKQVHDLERWFSPSPEQKSRMESDQHLSSLPFSVTPYFASLMTSDRDCPLFSQVIPSILESESHLQDRRDPLGEEPREVVPHLIHRYPDRVLFFASDRCASYCRYCTRKRFVGQGPTPSKDDHAKAFAYIRENPNIKEIVFSGGDPLVLSDERLDELLQNAFSIPHIEIVRIHSRMLTFAPMRITDGLVQVFKKYRPLFFVTHFNHPSEITELTKVALDKLIESGVVMLNQSVLLKGINDNVKTLEALLRALLRERVRPYYLHQCDVVEGASHFRVPVEKARGLMKAMRGNLSGLLLPTLVIDTPGGNGKMPIYPDPIVGEDEHNIFIEGFNGVISAYPKN